MSRLEQPQAGERIDRSASVSFHFDGKRFTGFAGDTIASALYAAGLTTFSRSFKYHRRRGELCGCGRCTNSLVTVDGAPGVRACGEPIREGMQVVHTNAWPSLGFDVMRATDLFGGPFTPPGFYYKTFIRPRRLWPLYEKILRNAAGLGVLPKEQDDRHWRTEYRRRHCDVLVVGGGAAGLSAAIAAAELGADVVLCDEDSEPGGALLYEGGHDEARELAARARAAGVEILTRAPALGAFDGLVPVWAGDTLHQVRAARIVLATGAIEQPLVFPNNDLPGVMLSSGAWRMAALYGVAPGTRAVVATVDSRGIAAADALAAAGIEIAGVADLREGRAILRADGSKNVRSVTIGAPDATTGDKVACDLVLVSGGGAPAASLLLQAGGRTAYSAELGHFAVEQTPDGVLVAGELAGHGAPGLAARSGSVAGREAALSLGLGDDASRGALEADRGKLHDGVVAEPVAVPAAAKPKGKGKAFVDFDEDVTTKDIALAAAEGYDSIELSKRYTTVTMGPSQGRFSQLASIRTLAGQTGATLDEVGITTARPPWTTVPMGVLAGRPFEAAKRSALHQRHRELGATVRWAGEWRRAYDYGDPEGEALAVQDGAGLIDVSTLGKLLVSGPDAGELLDRLYPNVISSLKPGRIRYGVLTSEAGRITDDGTVVRLDDDTFYVTTTSAGAAAVEQWFTWWRTVWELDCAITDVTQGVAAMNLAGPAARAVLGSLTELDCSSEGFGYLAAKDATVAGVACLLLRIGFVGEVGYEIHCSSAQAVHVWDAIMAAGDVRPFGLEPQRILRLQKLHILVGQDTDSESTPYGAALSWMVKLDKPQDFIGRWALENTAEQTPPQALVGFRSEHLPLEGSVVLDEAGVAAGQVTSSRWSPKLKQVIGMAWVPASLAHDDARITISDLQRRHPAVVTTKPFYDPEGEVQRS